MATTVTNDILAMAHNGIDTVMRLTANDLEKQYDEYCNQVMESQAYHRVQQISGFGSSQQFNEAVPISLDTRVLAGSQDIYHTRWGNGYGVTKQLKKADVYNAVGAAAPDAAVAHMQTKETIAAGLFNNGFNSSFTGPDAKELFSTAHPNASGVSNGSNYGDGSSSLPMSAANVETALVQYRKQKHHRGKWAGTTGKVKLITGPDQWPLAERIIYSSGLQGVADNDMNFSNRSRVEVVINDYLSSTTSWFLVTAEKRKNPLCMLGRIPFTMESEYFPKSWTFAFYWGEEIAMFWKDWRFSWGSPGT